jgi:hypothetical protein
MAALLRSLGFRGTHGPTDGDPPRGGFFSRRRAAAAAASAPPRSTAPTSVQPPPPDLYGGLDLCYVLPRLIVCGRPSMRGTDARDHRNNTQQLAAFLDAQHGGDYVIFNMSNKNRNTIDYSRLGGNAVLDFQPFSPAWVVDDAPCFSQTWR